MTGAGDTSDRLCVTVAAVLGIEPAALTEASSPDSVTEWDSLNHLNIVMAVESEFRITLSAEETLEMRNVGLIRSIVASHGVEV